MSTKFVPEEIVPILHRDLLQRYGGKPGIRDAGLLSSALSQPRMTYGGKFVHRTVFEKASAYGFHLCSNHPFIDGNKRTGHAAMETFLVLNGYHINTSVDEQVEIVLQVASGNVGREAFTDWLRHHVERR